MFFVTLKKVLAWYKNCIVLVIQANYSFGKLECFMEKKGKQQGYFFFYGCRGFLKEKTHTHLTKKICAETSQY